MVKMMFSKRFGEQIDKTLYLTTPNKSWKSAHKATEPREPQKAQNVFQRSKKLISFYDLGGEPPVMQFILGGRGAEGCGERGGNWSGKA